MRRTLELEDQLKKVQYRLDWLEQKLIGYTDYLGFRHFGVVETFAALSDYLNVVFQDGPKIVVKRKEKKNGSKS